jgi:hypothetical protein
MADVNINNPQPSNDRSAAAGINMVTVLIVLLAVIIIGWFLFAGPGRGILGPANIDVDVNTPSQQQPAQPPAGQNPPAQQPPAQAPAQPKGP